MMHPLVPLAATIGISIASMAVSPAVAQHCVTTECWTTNDCWWVGPGHMRCRRLCRRQCYDPRPQYRPPVYHAEPRYAPPADDPLPEPRRYVSAPYYGSSRLWPLSHSIPREAVWIVIGIVVALALIWRSLRRASAVDRAINRTIRNATSARKLAKTAEKATKNIDSLIARARADAYGRGRRAADAQWKEWSRE